MGEIIDFPVQDRSFSQVEAWVIRTCMQAGLTHEMANAVVAEYKPIHESLFNTEKSKLSIPPEAALSDRQVELITPVIRDLYLGQLAHAAHHIIGLLARAQLHQSNPHLDSF